MLEHLNDPIDFHLSADKDGMTVYGFKGIIFHTRLCLTYLSSLTDALID